MPRISELDLASSGPLNGDELVVIVQGGVTVQTTVREIAGTSLVDGVTSVNGDTGPAVVLAAADVGATIDPSLLSGVSNLTGAEILTVEQSGTPVQVTTQQIANLASGGGGGDSVITGDATDSFPTPSNPATLGVLSTTGIPNLHYDGGSTNEFARWIKRLPTAFVGGGTLDFTLKNVMESATSGNVRWGVRIMRLDADINVDSFDTAVEVTQAVSGDIDDPTTTTVPDVPVDGALANELIMIEIYRDASDTGQDTAAGEAWLYYWAATI